MKFAQFQRLSQQKFNFLSSFPAAAIAKRIKIAEVEAANTPIAKIIITCQDFGFIDEL